MRLDRETTRELARSPLPLFVLLSLLLLWIHEPWRDEAQPWLIARDAPSLFGEMDSEGSPALWYLLLLPLAKLGLPFASLRLLHLLIAAAALAVFVLRAPFGRVHKWLFAFGYFVLYEYNAIARSYVLVLLLLFVAAALYPRRHERPLLHGGLLLLLANVSAHATVLALVLGAAFALETLARRPRAPARLLGALLPFAGAALAVLQTLPADDLADERTRTYLELARPHFDAAAEAVADAFVPLPSQEKRWGRTLLEDLPPDGLLAAAGLLYAAALVPLLTRPRALGIWLAGSLALLAIVYAKHDVSGEIRHHGLLFVFYVFALWISRDEPPARVPPLSASGASAAWRWGLVALFAVHALASMPALGQEAEAPFSGGPQAAAFLRESGDATEDAFIGVYPSRIGPSVLVHLDDSHDRFFYPQEDAMGSYVRWTRQEADSFRQLGTTAAVERLLRAAANASAERVVLLTNFPLQGRVAREFATVAAYVGFSPGDNVFVHRWCGGPCPAPAEASTPQPSTLPADGGRSARWPGVGKGIIPEPTEQGMRGNAPSPPR